MSCTVTTCCYMWLLWLFLCTDFSHTDRHFLSIATIILVVMSCINLTLEGLQIFNRKLKYFYEWQNYVEISLSSLTISFVLITRFNNHSCFCPNASQWQLGSVVIFLAWIDLILLMNSVPFVAISINMLISITKSFLRLAFLPMLLIVSFGIPFFLLFHQPVSCLLWLICMYMYYIAQNSGGGKLWWIDAL